MELPKSVVYLSVYLILVAKYQYVTGIYFTKYEVSKDTAFVSTTALLKWTVVSRIACADTCSLEEDCIGINVR